MQGIVGAYNIIIYSIYTHIQMHMAIIITGQEVQQLTGLDRSHCITSSYNGNMRV